MLKLEKIDIKNFRSCKDYSSTLNDFTPLVGYNNAGKSNVLSAIKWLLRPFVLNVADYHTETNPVVISGLISGIDEEILGGLEQKHRTKIEPFCNNGIIQIRRIQSTPGGSIKQVALHVRDHRITDEGDEQAWNVNPTGIPEAITKLFPEPIEILAMDDITEDVGKSKSSTTIGKLIAAIMQPIEERHGAKIREALEEVGKTMGAEGKDRAPELKEFDSKVNEKLDDLFPGIKISLHIPPPEFCEIFKNGTIKVFEEDLDLSRDIKTLGHGAQRSIQMALIRYLAEINEDGGNKTTRTLLLVDEPELYLHPQAVEAVRDSLIKLSTEGFQVIFSTHSPLMITRDNIPTTLIVRKIKEQGTVALKRFAEALEEAIDSSPHQSGILFDLSNLSQILFSEKVLVGEGKTEKISLPGLFSLVKGRSLGASKIALVCPGGSCNIGKCLKILSAMGLHSKAVVDLDFAFRQASKCGYLTDDDTDISAAKGLFKTLSLKHNFELAKDGFPQKGGKLSSEDSFVVFANDETGSKYAESLHNKMLEHNVWLWEKGSINEYLGITNKNDVDTEVMEMLMKVATTGLDSNVKHPIQIKAFLEWLDRG